MTYNVLTTKADTMTHTTQTDYDDLLNILESQRVAIRGCLDDTHRARLDASLSETDREFAAIRQRHEEMIAQMFRKR
jgi:ABC-type phosphate transport system auxiliary subunit